MVPSIKSIHLQPKPCWTHIWNEWTTTESRERWTKWEHNSPAWGALQNSSSKTKEQCCPLASKPHCSGDIKCNAWVKACGKTGLPWQLRHAGVHGGPAKHRYQLAEQNSFNGRVFSANIHDISPGSTENGPGKGVKYLRGLSFMQCKKPRQFCRAMQRRTKPLYQ